MKRVLLSGATSYLGRHLLPELGKYYEVHALIRPGSKRPPLPVHQVHVFDGSPASVASAFHGPPYDAVIHLAAKTQSYCEAQDIPDFINTNVTLGALVLENMVLSGCKRLINASSFGQEYSEAQPVANGFYTATKNAFETILEFYVFAHDLNCISLRLFDIYGPQDERPRVLKQVLEAGQSPLKLSEGSQEIFLVHVSDVVSAVQTSLRQIFALNGAAHEKFDVRGESTSLRTAVETLVRVKGLHPSLRWGEIPYRKTQIMRPVRRSLLPDWQPQIDLEQGLKGL